MKKEKAQICVSKIIKEILLAVIVHFLVNLKINQLKMKKSLFKIIAKLNKSILPSFTKKQLDISRATKLQLIVIGWRAYITMNSLD